MVKQAEYSTGKAERDMKVLWRIRKLLGKRRQQSGLII
jgi:hypothetical protein